MGRAAVVLLAALSVLFSTVLAGRAYFYCAPMGDVSFDACCAPDAHDHPGPMAEPTNGPALDVEACCATRYFGRLVPASGPTVEPALRAPLAAVLPPVALPAAPPWATRADVPRSARAGPSPRSAREHLLEAMVSLT